ncbi:hypothetical protein GR160_08620 [Flavobacterium sp. Sd200]|uniref:hypothetical protein n=1 Tax=Flavobacterium sp. Sd200 TaxID=2692211 RepID=UPI001372147A|nr:hypothetical protein [Flavobacterium sp. Sd200]MXN91291.1 hypothetical protein [Flavobacterium sp. Sd200]
MANEKIVLAQLDIDIKGLIAAAGEATAALKKINDELQNLKESGQESSQYFAGMQQQAQLFTKLLEQQKTALQEQIKQQEKLAEAQKNVAGALDSTARAQQNLTNSMAAGQDLTAEYADNAADATDAINGLNAALNQNRALMADNAETERQVKTFNDYKEQVTESFNSINIFNGGLGGLISRAQEAGGTGTLLKNAFSGITGGIKGMGQAIAANPLGILLMVLAPIIEQLKNFAPLTNAVEKAMAALSPVIDIVTAPIQVLAQGITWVVEGFTKLMGAMSSAAGEASKLKQAEQELATQMTLQQSVNEKVKQQTDELIKKSQDHTLSERERANALRQAFAIENKNYSDRKKLANDDYANKLKNLQLSKDLSDSDIQILEEGTAASVHKLMQQKNISKEELDTLQKAKTTKMGIAAEETNIKKQQANSFKTITDELIQKSKNQKLSEEERINALKQATANEIAYYKDRRAQATASYNQAMADAFKNKGIRKEDIDGLLAHGNAYKEKARVLKLMSQEEINTLINAHAEKQRLSREEIQMLENQKAAEKQLKDQIAAEEKAEAAERQRAQQERQKKAAQDTAQKLKLELDLLMENESRKTKTLEQELELAKKVAAQKKAIADAEFAATDKTGNDILAKKLAYAKIDNELAQEGIENAAKVAQAKVDAAGKEVQEFINANQSKLDDDKFFSQESYNAEVARLDSIAQKQEEYQTLRKNLGVITEQEYQDAINAIHDANSATKDGLRAEREEAEKTKLAIDLENKRAADTANMDYDLGFQLDKLDAEKKQELDAAEKTGADKKLIEDKYAKLEKDTRMAVMNNKLDLANSTFTSLQGILGKESAAGKAMAVAQATIDTYKSAVSAYSSMSGIPIVGPALGAVAAAAAVAAGIANVKKITSTKAPKAEKGALFSIGGNRHSNGGTMFTGADGTRFEAEKGELIGVMNRNAAAHFMAFNNAFPAGGSSAPNYFANGGIVSREIASPSLNVDELATKIAQANTTIPAPVVAVQDIIAQGNSYVQVRDAANF